MFVLVMHPSNILLSRDIPNGNPAMHLSDPPGFYDILSDSTTASKLSQYIVPVEEHFEPVKQETRDLVNEFTLTGPSLQQYQNIYEVFYPRLMQFHKQNTSYGFRDTSHTDFLDLTITWKGLTMTEAKELRHWEEIFQTQLKIHVQEHYSFLATEKKRGKIYASPYFMQPSDNGSRYFTVDILDLIQDMATEQAKAYPDETWFESQGIVSILVSFLMLHDCFLPEGFYDENGEYTGQAAVGLKLANKDQAGFSELGDLRINWAPAFLSFASFEEQPVEGSFFQLKPDFQHAQAAAWKETLPEVSYHSSEDWLKWHEKSQSFVGYVPAYSKMNQVVKPLKITIMAKTMNRLASTTTCLEHVVRARITLLPCPVEVVNTNESGNDGMWIYAPATPSIGTNVVNGQYGEAGFYNGMVNARFNMNERGSVNGLAYSGGIEGPAQRVNAKDGLHQLALPASFLTSNQRVNLDLSSNNFAPNFYYNKASSTTSSLGSFAKEKAWIKQLVPSDIGSYYHGKSDSHLSRDNSAPSYGRNSFRASYDSSSNNLRSPSPEVHYQTLPKSSSKDSIYGHKSATLPLSSPLQTKSYSLRDPLLDPKFGDTYSEKMSATNYTKTTSSVSSGKMRNFKSLTIKTGYEDLDSSDIHSSSLEETDLPGPANTPVTSVSPSWSFEHINRPGPYNTPVTGAFDDEFEVVNRDETTAQALTVATTFTIPTDGEEVYEPGSLIPIHLLGGSEVTRLGETLSNLMMNDDIGTLEPGWLDQPLPKMESIACCANPSDSDSLAEYYIATPSGSNPSVPFVTYEGIDLEASQHGYPEVQTISIAGQHGDFVTTNEDATEKLVSELAGLCCAQPEENPDFVAYKHLIAKAESTFVIDNAHHASEIHEQRKSFVDTHMVEFRALMAERAADPYISGKDNWDIFFEEYSSDESFDEDQEFFSDADDE